MKPDVSKFTGTLTAAQRDVLVNAATEAPFSGEYVDFDGQGNYNCAACGTALFSSDTKFDSGCGWPSFYNVIDTAAVKLVADNSHGMQRVEIRCANCQSHLGHVFNDAPDQPTGMRFCVNSLALNFSDKQTAGVTK